MTSLAVLSVLAVMIQVSRETEDEGNEETTFSEVARRLLSNFVRTQ